MMKFFDFFLFLNFFFCFNQLTNGFIYNDNIFLEVLKKYTNVQNYYYRNYQEIIVYMKMISTDSRINLDCRNSYLKLINGLEKKDVWALKFFESIGTSVNGKLNGHNFNYGSFDYCYNLIRNSEDDIDFDGKYCVITVHTPETEETKKLPEYKNNLVGLSEDSKNIVEYGLGNAHGVCIPSTCDINQLTNSLNGLISSLDLKIITPKYCATKKENSFSLIQILIFCLFAIILLFCVISSFSKKKFFQHFSISKNYNLIYGEKKEEDENSLNYIYGFKTYMVLLSIGIYTLGAILLIFPYISSTLKEVTISKQISTFIEKILVVSDQMFFFGGFFCMFSWYNFILKNEKQFSFFKYFILRYIKVFISSLIFLLVILILPQLGNGPFYLNITNHFANNCKNGFWKMFLLYSNEDKVFDMCSIPTWYLNAEFQIYILHFFIVYYLVVKPKLGLILMLIQFLVNSVFLIFFNYYNSNRPFYDFKEFDIYTFYEIEKIYFHSFYHYNTYTFGVLVAWYIKSQKMPKILEKKRYRILGQIITGIISSSAFWIPTLIGLKASETNTIRSAIWPIIDKILFNTFISWKLCNLGFGYQKKIKKVITTGFFVNWSKLTYSLTISQFIFILYFTGSIRTTISFSFLTILKEYFSICFGSWLFALFLFVTLEAPLTNLTYSLLKIKKLRDYKSKEDNCNIIEKESDLTNEVKVLEKTDLNKQELIDVTSSKVFTEDKF